MLFGHNTPDLGLVRNHQIAGGRIGLRGGERSFKPGGSRIEVDRLADLQCSVHGLGPGIDGGTEPGGLDHVPEVLDVLVELL